MKRKAATVGGSKKRAKKEYEAIATLNEPATDYFRTAQPPNISASVVCFGSNIQNKFFAADASVLKLWTTKTTNNIKTPVQLNFSERGTPDGVKLVVAGQECSYLLTNDGKCFAVGTNSRHNLGAPKRCNLKPGRILQDHKIVHIDSAYSRALFITSTGRAMVCGGFFHGVFGMNDSSSYATPVDMAPNQEHPRFISGHLGETHTVFITNTGSLYGTGEKFSFGCGDYVTANRATEAMEQKLTELTIQRVTQVACGAQYTCALTDKHELWVTGVDVGQLPTTQTNDRWRLVQVGVKQVLASRRFYAYQNMKDEFTSVGEAGNFSGCTKVFSSPSYMVGLTTNKQLRVVVQPSFVSRTIKLQATFGNVINQYDAEFSFTFSQSHAMAVVYFGRKKLEVYPRLLKILQRQVLTDIDIIQP